MPEHPTRPTGVPPRRRAALAATGLAVAGLVVGSLALVARDGPGQAPRSAVVPPAEPTTAPVPTIGTSVSTLRSAGVDQAREAPAGSECPPDAGGRRVAVRTARELQRALDKAVRGQRIQLADGVYQGEFVLRRSGTASQRIALCGTRRAELRGDTLKEGYVLHLDGADHWTLSGFTVTNGEKGIMADRANHNVVQDVAVHHIGHEGIHLRNFSSDNLVKGNLVHHTGLRKARYGEGVYVGSAHSNWCQHSGCKPDRSDRNKVVGNRIGPEVTAESVDLKEGTSSGTVSGNVFTGKNMTGADSWVDVKGNAWTVQGNRGSLSPQDGFQVHVEAPGWGRGNKIAGNSGDLGPGGEYGVRVDKDAAGTVVGCDNKVSGAAKGLSNIPCH
ncbi:MAG TPA: right-handed parallel beta-helix repeat-containing protein [Actinomycetota bacterium]|nr:right-handed parallel beta-helix repeat-containing protein [Actinomycetota bacterium]